MKDYEPSKPILTNEEMIAVLNLDDDYSPLSKLEGLSKEASQFLYQRQVMTGVLMRLLTRQPKVPQETTSIKYGTEAMIISKED